MLRFFAKGRTARLVHDRDLPVAAQTTRAPSIPARRDLGQAFEPAAEAAGHVHPARTPIITLGR